MHTRARNAKERKGHVLYLEKLGKIGPIEYQAQVRRNLFLGLNRNVGSEPFLRPYSRGMMEYDKE
jgi:hypothetical protein